MPAASEPGYFCTNGMSLSRRDSQFANSGLMITLEPEHFGSPHALAGMHLQRLYERRAYELGGAEYACPIQLPADFLKRRQSTGQLRSSYPRSLVAADLRELLPPQVAAALDQGLGVLDRRWRGALTICSPAAVRCMGWNQHSTTKTV